MPDEKKGGTEDSDIPTSAELQQSVECSSTCRFR
jgi:hypothetical protein